MENEGKYLVNHHAREVDPMVRSRVAVLSVALVLVLSLAAAAQEGIGSKKAYPASAPIVLDGFAGDWGIAGLEPTLRVDPAFSLVNAGAIADAAESSADVYILYDDEYVYLLANVVDDNVTGPYSGGGSLWQNSAVELWFSFSGVPADPAQYAFYTAEDYQINLVPMTGGAFAPTAWVYPAAQDAHNINNPIEIAARLWESPELSGYVVEARVPKALFPGFSQVTAGGTFRFAVSLVHVDAATAAWEHIWTPGVEYVTIEVQ